MDTGALCLGISVGLAASTLPIILFWDISRRARADRAEVEALCQRQGDTLRRLMKRLHEKQDPTLVPMLELAVGRIDALKAKVRILNRRAQRADREARIWMREAHAWERWCRAAWLRINALRLAHGDRGDGVCKRHPDCRENRACDGRVTRECLNPTCIVCEALRPRAREAQAVTAERGA